MTQHRSGAKARELKERQAGIALRIEPLRDGESGFRVTLKILLSVASPAADIFEGSNIAPKRQPIAFAFSNLRLRGKKLEFSLRSPVDAMVDRPDDSSWLGDLDSNQDCAVQSREFYR